MQDSWALFPALPLTHWLISHKSCPASVPQFPYPSDKDNAAPLLGESAGTFLYGSVKDRTHLSHPAPVRETPPPSQSQLAVILRNAQKPLFFFLLGCTKPSACRLQQRVIGLQNCRQPLCCPNREPVQRLVLSQSGGANTKTGKFS